ncbi:MBL fold metallo-hydrolase [Geodermatophilus amargosae]|uniref:MBL fold metallo-hydrolase n=1 Tax=Geodermatophilus amargosae TaxID=1296565 RepID=UPI0034DFF80C
MSVPQIVPGLYLLELGISNAYLWRDDSGVTLVDTGLPGSAPMIAEALTGLGLRREDVRRVVLTHFHDDHCGSAAAVHAWNGAPVVVGAADAPVVRRDRPGPEPVITPAEEELFTRASADVSPAPACRPVQPAGDGDVLDGGAVVLGVPGHTPGSIAVHLPEAGVLLTGDTVAESGGDLILGPFNTDRAQAWTSLQRLAALEADVVCPGHGRPLAGGAAAALRAATDPFG